MRLRADARVLGIAVNNPLSNAVKFTPGGGRIDVVVDDRAADTVTLSITDTGIGMSADEVERAMLPFVQIGSQLERRFEGTGLGLTLAKRAAEKLGIPLTIASRPGQGTTVTVAIPASLVGSRRSRPERLTRGAATLRVGLQGSGSSEPAR